MTLIAQDTFTRANQSGWGTASDSHVWSHPTGSQTLAIASNLGTLTGGFETDVMLLGSGTATDCQALVRVTKQASDGAFIVLRAQDGSNYYLLGHSIDFNGYLEIAACVSGSNTDLGHLAFSTTSGQAYWIRALISGTTLNLRMWQDGTTEPTSWNITVTDSTYSAGQYGLGDGLRSGSTTLYYDSLSVYDGGGVGTQVVGDGGGLFKQISGPQVKDGSGLFRLTSNHKDGGGLFRLHGKQPLPLPIISRSAVAYTNDNDSGTAPASYGNSSNYSNVWRSAATPSSGSPIYLAYDLSSIPTIQRGPCLLAWYNAANGDYDFTINSNPCYNLAQNYTIDANSAAGGSYPSSGWTTLVTVTSNNYHSRQHSINLSGYNWVRINVTSIQGSTFNEGVALKMDIHNAANGLQDDGILYGDSITAGWSSVSDLGDGTLAQMINAQVGGQSLGMGVWEGAGVGGRTAADESTYIPTNWLPLFPPGRYVAVNLGTNDSNGSEPTATYKADMQTIITAILNAGCIPVIPHIPYGLTTAIQANAPAMNTAIDQLIASNPGTLAGPDQWSFFQANPGLISGDQVHPSNPAGYRALRQLWARSLAATIYLSNSMDGGGLFRLVGPATFGDGGGLFRLVSGKIPHDGSGLFRLESAAEMRDGGGLFRLQSAPRLSDGSGLFRQISGMVGHDGSGLFRLKTNLTPNILIKVRGGLASPYATGKMSVVDDFSPMVVGDTGNPLVVQFVHDEDGSAVPLYGCTLSMSMVLQGGTIVNCSGLWTVDDAINGIAHYQWQSGDVSQPGIWLLSIAITNAAGPFHADPRILEIQ